MTNPRFARDFGFRVTHLGSTTVLLRPQRRSRPIEAAPKPLTGVKALISLCANPACGRPFHYLRGGRLYRFEVRAPSSPCKDVPNAICSTKPSHSTVFFWLCEPCSRKFSLQFKSHEGASLVPLTDPAFKAGSHPGHRNRAEVEMTAYSAFEGGLSERE